MTTPTTTATSAPQQMELEKKSDIPTSTPTPTPLLIGIGGAYGSGKNSLTCGFKSLGFAVYAATSPVRAIAVAAGFTRDQVYGSKRHEINDKTGMCSRRYVQSFGLDRKVVPQKTLPLPTLAVNDIDTFISEHKGQNIVIYDVRFKEEADTIREHGGTIVILRRHGFEAGTAAEIIDAPAPVAAAPAAPALARPAVEGDIMLYNGGTRAQLKSKACDIVDAIKNRKYVQLGKLYMSTGGDELADIARAKLEHADAQVSISNQLTLNVLGARLRNLITGK